MRRTLRGCLLTGLLLAVAHAQTATQPLPGLTGEQTAQLLRHRAIIENTADSEGTRQGQAEELLLTGWPAAADLLVKLLETCADASTRVVICRAVARVEIIHPELVDVRLADSLVRLLADADRSVSGAAAAALSAFREEYVVRRLGALARDPGRPIEQRLAAVNALAPNIDHRPVIEQLLDLLSVEETMLRDRVHASLAPASRADYGRSMEAWLPWWQEKSSLDETAWLKDRVELFIHRARDAELRLETLRRESESRYITLSRRLGDVLRLNYRLTAQEAQKDALLTTWLRDPLIDFRRTAVDLIRGQIYDQKRPSSAVRSALRERYADVSPALRREVLELVAALNDPTDMGPILARLPVETDVSVRETILGVLGKLRNPDALPVLIEEIADNSSPSNCAAKAAHSLATLARENPDAPQLTRAVGPLAERLAITEADDVLLRGALLGAMASIGSAEFTGLFIAHLDDDRPELLLPAIRGIVAVCDRDQLSRLRALFMHADPRVRLEAIEAVGTLGDGETPLEALVNHLNAAAEANEAVRSAAWGAFCAILERQPPETRLEWAGRLQDLPGLQIEYLTAVVEDFASAGPVPAQLDEARELLARLLRAQGRYAESVRHLQELYASGSDGDGTGAGEVGVLLLDSLLRNGQYSERIDRLLPELAQRGDDVRAAVVRTVTAYLDEAMQTDNSPELAALAERLRRACAGSCGQAFDDYLADAIGRSTPPPTTGPADQP